LAASQEGLSSMKLVIFLNYLSTAHLLMHYWIMLVDIMIKINVVIIIFVSFLRIYLFTKKTIMKMQGGAIFYSCFARKIN
jgi:hypothetical protein